MTEQEYRDLPSDKYYSYSFLSMVDREGPSSIIKEKDLSNNKAIRWGSLAHTLLFEEDTVEDKYKVLYYVDNSTVTYDKLHEVIKSAFLEENLTFEDIKHQSKVYIDLCLETVKDLKLWSNIKDPKILYDKFCNEDYLNFALEDIENITDERIFVSAQEFLDTSYMCQVLKENKDTKPYLVSTDVKKTQILFETPILFKLLDKDFKALLDIICINHSDKTIRMADLKTGSESYKKFNSKFFFWRYDIQAALYTIALEQFVIQNNLKDYKILEPIYIYVNKKDIDYPHVFKIDRGIVERAVSGYRDIFGTRHKGIIELVEEIEFYRSKNQYNYEMNYLKNGFYTIENHNMVIDTHRTIPNETFNNFSNRIFSNNIESINDNPFQDHLNSLERELSYRRTRRGTLNPNIISNSLGSVTPAYNTSIQNIERALGEVFAVDSTATTASTNRTIDF